MEGEGKTPEGPASGNAAPPPVYYWDYLQLDKILSAQEPESAKHGADAPDEMLFIIVHQAFELWFKQILHELDGVLDVMGPQTVAENAMGRVVASLRRITEIQRLLLNQLEVLETMTPLDFLDFREFLVPASGFQSVQFRLIENRLGLTPRHRLKIKGAAYTDVLHPPHAQRITDSEHEPSVYDHVERWLERTPFLHFGDFDFWQAYREAVEAMQERDRRVIMTQPYLDEAERSAQLARFEETNATFSALFDRDRWEQLRAAGKRRLSHQAVLAALLISLYRDEPIFHLPFRFLTGLVDIDEGFTAWRQRHALMAHRMIGSRIGTGGTSGHDYLEAAARKHRIFAELFDLPTFFIPRSSLPPLPAAVRQQLAFRYAEPAPSESAPSESSPSESPAG